MKTNPSDTSRNVRRTAYLAMLVASRRLTENCLRILEQQQRTLAAAHRRRRADDGGSRPECPGGDADLQHHYGRRCNDVDIERL